MAVFGVLAGVVVVILPLPPGSEGFKKGEPNVGSNFYSLFFVKLKPLFILVKTTVLIFLSAIARAWVVSPYLWRHLDWTLPFGKLFNKVYSFG